MTGPARAFAVARASDHITILTTQPGRIATKKISKVGSRIEVSNYDGEIRYGLLEGFGLNSIFDLSTVLTALESFQSCLVIRGMPVDDGLYGTWIRRKSFGPEATFHSSPAGHHWLMIDIDKLTLPPGITLRENLLRVLDHVVRLLPAAFHDATYHWTLSSKAGLGEESVVSMHLWFWLANPADDKSLKSWAKSVNQTAVVPLIDIALFGAVQPHYTASPVFVGLADPFPTRSGLSMQRHACVQLALPNAQVSAAKKTAIAKASTTGIATGFDSHLAAIGDHAGGLGFHNAILSAAASYVATHGNANVDVEYLLERLRARVLSADRTRHDLAYVEEAASRGKIMPLITSAMEKYGANHDGRRKSRLHVGVQPHFTGPVMSVIDAQRLLAKVAGLN